MRISTITLGALLLAASATPAFAQDTPPLAPDAKDAPAAAAAAPEPKAVTVTGGVTLISDYRFRGVTQTNGDGAVQGTINVNSKYGFYVGTWASTIDGSGKTPALSGYGDAEVDLYAGYTKTFSGLTVDGGVLYYYYPSHDKAVIRNTDFFEPYASVSYTFGPVGAKVGAAYAWGGQAGLRGFDVRGGNDDNIYAYGEATIAVPKTPVTLKGHFGYSDGSLGSLNPAGSNDNNYFDWSTTAEAVGGPFKVGVSYIDTDITERRDLGTGGHGFARNLGRGSTVLGYVSFAF